MRRGTRRVGRTPIRTGQVGVGRSNVDRVVKMVNVMEGRGMVVSAVVIVDTNGLVDHGGGDVGRGGNG